MRWLGHVLGLDSATGAWYLWWSGFAGDLTLIAAAGAWLRHRNCHTRACWRLGRYPVDGTGFVMCSRHHPLART